MKPAPFEYYEPAGVAEAVQTLAAIDDAKVIAGGQSLMPMLNMRIAQPAALVDIGRLGALDYVRHEDGRVAVGAVTPQRVLEMDARTRAQLPVVAEVIRHIGHVTIRNRGTVGGSLSHADPAAELPVLAVALDAELVAQGPQGRRVIAAADFFETYLTTALAPDELLVEARFGAVAGGGFGFEELNRRSGDFALASALAIVETHGGTCTAARIAVGGAHPVPLRVGSAEQLLIGEPVSERLVRAAADVVGRSVEPLWDVHASADYRRHAAVTLAERAIWRAYTMDEGATA